MIRAGCMAAALAIGCSSPPSTPARDVAPAQTPAADAPDLARSIPTTWAELETMTTSIRSGTWQPEGLDSPRLGCLDAGGARTCVERSSALYGPAWLGPPGAGEAWLATLSAPPGPAAVARSRDALLEVVKCSLLERLWQTVPEQHRACAADADCELLTDTCFAAPMARASAEPYRQLIRRVGAVCLDPAGGMCPPSTDEPRCVAHRCTAIEQR